MRCLELVPTEIPGTPYLIIDNAAMGIYYFPMARIARVVVPGLPHHIMQRGNRRQETFFIDDDYQEYLHPMEKNKQRELDFMQKIIDVKKIDPSPYQVRKHFDEDKLKELAATIEREGLIGPIMVRPNGGRYELIAGERRLRAVRDYTEIKTIAT